MGHWSGGKSQSTESLLVALVYSSWSPECTVGKRFPSATVKRGSSQSSRRGRDDRPASRPTAAQTLWQLLISETERQMDGQMHRKPSRRPGDSQTCSGRRDLARRDPAEAMLRHAGGVILYFVHMQRCRLDPSRFQLIKLLILGLDRVRLF